MPRLEQWSSQGAGQDKRLPQSRDELVERVDIGHTAAKDDDVGVKDVDDAGERARHATCIALDRRDGRRLPAYRCGGDVFRTVGCGIWDLGLAPSIVPRQS